MSLNYLNLDFFSQQIFMCLINWHITWLCLESLLLPLGYAFTFSLFIHSCCWALWAVSDYFFLGITLYFSVIPLQFLFCCNFEVIAWNKEFWIKPSAKWTNVNGSGILTNTSTWEKYHRATPLLEQTHHSCCVELHKWKFGGFWIPVELWQWIKQ